MTPGPKG